MHRSLLVQLIAIVVVTLGVIAVVAMTITIWVTEPALERYVVYGRARSVTRLVHGMWGRADRDTLRRELLAFDDSDPDLIGVEVFRLEGDTPSLFLTTRPSGTADVPSAADVARLTAGRSIRRTLPDPDGAGPFWRVELPLRSEDRVLGAVQIDLSLARLTGFLRHMHWVAYGIVAFFATLTAFLLAMFLDRRVVRPVTALAHGMRRVERGERGARVELAGRGELSSLACSFNSMAVRLEELTAGLEAQVERATLDLAEKNRELGATNTKLVRAQAELLRNERLSTLGQMAATMAHELGTPLNSILGYTQLLLRDDLRPQQIERLRIVESQVQRMIETIRSVLDRTRDRGGRRDQVCLDALVREAVSMVEGRLQRCGLAAHVDVPPDLPAIPGDPVGLRQVLLNLLDNAIDASAPSGTIVVRAVLIPRQNGRGPQVELSVRDPGYGMTQEEIRLAFQPFYTTKTSDRGTGLGLVIVDYIVRAHGGRVDVESARGEGTTMRVFLPVEA